MASTSINPLKLDFYLEHGFNVLFVGRHGCGKTTMIKDCFERAGLRLGETFLYFSAATLDPWVDLVGVPKEVKNEDGTSYLELVRPKALASGNIQAMFFDEYNRSSKKVRNSVMELIQFHSINGKPFPNLKVVWAAVNPDEGDEYDVEKIDPAQEDRFHVKVEVPYKPSLTWFTNRFSKALAKASIEWWKELPVEEQNNVSPRRLEYALQMYQLGGDLRDIIPVSSNASKLLKALQSEPVTEILGRHYEKKDSASAYVYLNDENNYYSAIVHILKDTDWMDFYLPLVSKEHLIGLMASNARVKTFIVQNEEKHERFGEVLDEVLKAVVNRDLAKSIRDELNLKKNKARILTKDEEVADISGLDDAYPGKRVFKGVIKDVVEVVDWDKNMKDIK